MDFFGRLKARAVFVLSIALGIGLAGVSIAAIAPTPSYEPSGTSRPITPDEKLLAVDQSIIGFGGYGRDKETGELFVYLSDSTKRNTTADALLKNKLIENIGEFQNAQVRHAQFSVHELIAWRDTINQNIDQFPNWTTLYISESDNQIVLGVRDKKAEVSAASGLNVLSIPNEAVRLEITGSWQLSSHTR